jgi:hypothetical protein
MKSLTVYTAPANGRDAAGQCIMFKELVRNTIGPETGNAGLNSVHQVTVQYDPSSPVETEWAERVLTHAAEIKEQIESGVRPRVKRSSWSMGV